METQLPTWLEQSPETDLLQSEHQPIQLSLEHRAATLALAVSTYETILDDTLEKISGAKLLPDIVDDYNDSHATQIDADHFRAWIFKDKERKAKFHSALELGAYAHLDKSFRIASGVENPMEDVARSTLRVKQHMIAAKAFNKRVFGEDGSTGGGSGAVTVNITGVVSPYAKPATPTITPVITDNNLTIDV
jgi:hypothetical protein